ncbi:MAG: class I poly(R)-hydroxyalkanoic acid synthase, partial [Marivivens sp.]
MNEDNPADLGKLEANIARLEELNARLVAALGRKKLPRASLEGPGQDLYLKAAAGYLAEMMQNPAKILEHQVGYWGKSLKHYLEAQQKLAQGKFEAPDDTGPKDKRFANPLWDTNPYFNFLKQQYLMNADAVHQAVTDVDGLDDADRKRLDFFTRQIVDMFSPTNFLGTNPEALERAAETQGQSLVDGLENLVRDLEAGDGDLVVSLSDKDAFKVGE